MVTRPAMLAGRKLASRWHAIAGNGRRYSAPTEQKKERPPEIFTAAAKSFACVNATYLNLIS